MNCQNYCHGHEAHIPLVDENDTSVELGVTEIDVALVEMVATAVALVKGGPLVCK